MINFKKNNRTLAADILKKALVDAFIKLNPLHMMKNPVMFVVEVGLLLTLLLTVWPDLFGGQAEGLRLYNGIVSLILLLTVLFANFAEAVAEGRGKAQAASLRLAQKDTQARRLLADGGEEITLSSHLNKGDRVLVRKGETIPGDGEVVEGVALVDESAITGESAPVVKESGGDFSSVTGGTTVISDWLIMEVTSAAGESFLDKMVAMVEGASRQKTPNELALNILLAALSIIFLIVIVTLWPLSAYSGITIPVATLVALTVCLIPTTIGGLLSAIGIAGMDRVTRFNVIAMSGKAVEACGDVDTMILDKTGTITCGNRMASEFLPVSGVDPQELARCAVLSSLQDETPEGRSIVELGKCLGLTLDLQNYEEAKFIAFSGQTRMSGIDLADGSRIRKGAFDVIEGHVKNEGRSMPEEANRYISEVASEGATPLLVTLNGAVMGVITLKDIIKPGLVERFACLRRMGIKTIMCTGDNPLTAAAIAEEAGVDGFVAECRPEDKIRLIKDEQAQGKVVAMTGDGTNDAPALAQADVGLAMNSGTIAAKEAANMVDLDSDPTKIIEVVEIGKELLITRGALTTFSIANDVGKYFAVIPAIFAAAIPQIQILNVMGLATTQSAVLSALVFNAIIIPLLIPLALKGVGYKPGSASALLRRNMLVYGLGGIIAPFAGIKIIDLCLAPLLGGFGM